MPNYTRRDGVLNLFSHFPFNVVAPDIGSDRVFVRVDGPMIADFQNFPGPKMYNANGNPVKTNTKGSTRLHLDMADALNIMAYAAPDAEGGEGGAIWDIFRAEDSPRIRQFLSTKEGQDPIHSHEVYLDDGARCELWKQYNVNSYRVYQKTGQAVFIPAGCAHQVGPATCMDDRT